jgi:hypothetical protein
MTKTKSKKNIKVRDLKPNKDAKGGGQSQTSIKPTGSSITSTKPTSTSVSGTHSTN